MTTVQMNVRIDAQLKATVDDVLRRNGASASDMIRSVWSYIADRQQLPLLETTAEEEARQRQRLRKLALIDESAGYAQKELAQVGAIDASDDPFGDLLDDESPSDIGDAMYGQRLDEYLAMERGE
ncbi:type II toxin-antitoxin system RelB/DinJ family antitoxin [Bifidobacterium callimiconis]|uniref:Damage-inducible protein J n=1 Tax=Bifidobacterium callimiconis TaxID=2306973 RepID=A0A430FFN0_9BIFI|nr:type II toxin-antitoxin system RelB/DinJ family antitoxin [Bifidobacterium callimiconis]MBT1176012.1 type II toxin-antitoxin system RelB/DinJ family antitoxin [Bifidobacterium callimiconis]RSX51646.1 damage-inducible protein J [Bifidobacterium callimiconis]